MPNSFLPFNRTQNSKYRTGQKVAKNAIWPMTTASNSSCWLIDLRGAGESYRHPYSNRKWQNYRGKRNRPKSVIVSELSFIECISLIKRIYLVTVCITTTSKIPFVVVYTKSLYFRCLRFLSNVTM